MGSAYLLSAAKGLWGLTDAGYWAMLSAYFDESGTHLSSRILVVAGLVAEPREWVQLDREWNRTLSGEGISDFHMKDFAHSVGQFKGWTKHRRDDLISRLIGTIKRRVTARVWSVILMDDYRQIFGLDEVEEFPFTICAFGCASRLKWFAEQRSPDLFIPYTFEQGGKGSHHAFESFNRLLADGRPDFYRMGPLAIARRELTTPLQAADIHAYELHKYFSDQIEETGRGIRRSFQELLNVKDAGGYLFTLEKLKMFVEQGRARQDRADIPVDKMSPDNRLVLRMAPKL